MANWTKGFKKYFEENEFTIDKNTARGTMFGFDIQASYTNADPQHPLRIFIPCYMDPQNINKVYRSIRSLKINFFTFEYQQGIGLYLGLNDWTNGVLIKKLSGHIENITNILKENGALGVGYCSKCGKEIDPNETNEIDYHGYKLALDEECRIKIAAVIKAEETFEKSIPNNYLKGALGAFVGAAAGVFLAFFLSTFNIISGWSSIVSFALGYYLYKKFGGKPNKGMIAIIASFTMIAMLSFTLVLYSSAATNIALQAGVTNVNAFAYCMDNIEEFREGFISDIISTLVITLIPTVIMVVTMSINLKKKKLNAR